MLIYMNTITIGNKKTSIKIKALVAQAVSEVLSDPDFGMELTEHAKRRLEKARKQKGKSIPFSEIKKRYL